MARDREYEKQARAYTRFIVQAGRTVSGWEYPEDARDELRAMKQEGRALPDVKIVARSQLAKYGIDPKRPFHVSPAAIQQWHLAWKKAEQHESGNNPKLRGGKKTDIVFHKDGSATSWNVHTQSFSRMRRGKVSDELLSSLSSEERERVTRHLYADSRKAMLADLARAKHITNPVEREAKVSQLRGALQDIGATEAEIRKALSSSPSAAKHESGNNPRVARALKTRIDRLIGKRK